MLKLHHINNGVYVFNVDDWIELRKNHRIIGVLVGNLTLRNNLPCKLLPEEFLYLHYKNIAKLVEFRQSKSEIKYEAFEDELLNQQKLLYKDNRKRKLLEIIDNIVEAKKRRGDNRNPNDILQAELAKSSTISKNNMIWPILTHSVLTETIDIDASYISDYTTETKFFVFKDLLDKGYFITHGHKFGGDFLVYVGEPVIHHAIFIVRCIEDPDKQINPAEIVAFGRVGTSVKKRAVLASLSNDKKPNYITISWPHLQ